MSLTYRFRPTGWTPGGGGGGGTNEPSGMTQLTERSWSAHDEDGWGHTDDANYTIETDVSGAPESPPNVGQALYPSGGSGGTALGTNAWKSGLATSDWKHLYLRFWHRVDAGWHGHSSGVNKILYLLRDSSQGAPCYLSYHGTDDGPFHPQMRTQDDGNINYRWDGASDGTSNTSGVSDADAQLTPGTWHEWEVHLVYNTLNNKDGSCELWIDGTKVLEYLNSVRLSGDGVSEALKIWNEIKWNPVWGGSGDTVPDNQFQQMDHLYASAKVVA